jgi:Skp family chaperone for outer membrane proteins
MQTANSTLNLFQQKLEEDLQTRQKYLESKYNEYLQLAESGAKEDALKPMEDEIRRLDEEVKRKASESEQKMIEKRTQLIAPISDKIQLEIKAMAAEGGFDLILNSVDGTGNSIVLFGPENNDLTEALLKRMGVTIPAEQK